MKKRLLSCLAAVVLSGADAAPMKIVQLDLARQMMPLSSLSNWVDRVSAYGYDTVQLYLEGRVATKTFSLPKGESYPAAEMAQFVRYATGKGLTVVPCVGLLGHAEHFFRYPGNEAMDELREGKPRFGQGRQHNTFCLSSERTRSFLRQYVGEVAAIFPGPYFNVGLDEAWNAGVCSLCAPKEAKDELFSEVILFCHEIVTAAGKRMWMWDDFFGFHPKALAKTPRDVVMCHWDYSTRVSSRGRRENFAGRLREDGMARYAEMGFEVIPACWFKSGNAEALFAYASRYPMKGFMMTQWEEMRACFLGGSLPRLAAMGLMLSDPETYPARDPYPDAIRKVLPSLTPDEVLAAATIYHKATRPLPTSLSAALSGAADAAGPTDIELALAVLKGSALRPYANELPADEFSERAILDDLVCRGETALLADRIARAAPRFSDPRRTPAEIRGAQASLRPVLPALERLAARRTAQMDAWRPGCVPRHAANGATEAIKLVKDLLARPAEPAPADERRLEVVLVLPEFYGRPHWTVCGRFEDGWRELAKGSWKPGANDWAVYSKFFTFSSKTMPTELRIEHQGYGRAQLVFLSVEDRTRRIVPTKVLAADGDVEHPERLLRDDVEWADFGTCGFLDKFYDAGKAAKLSSVTLEMSR